MPSFKFTGTNAEGHVTFGGKRFDKDQPVDVDDPALVAKLEGNGEFERIGGPTEGEAPVWAPPGPSGIGTGPGSGPYITTNEVIDTNPNPDAGQKTAEELEEERQAADTGPEVEPTDEGPKRKSKKSASSPDEA